MVAWDQLEVPFDAPPATTVAIDGMPQATLRDQGNTYTVSGGDFAVTIGKASGAIESLKFKGNELVASPLVPNFWRCPIDNDDGNQMVRRLGAWKNAGPGRTVESVTAEQVQPAARPHHRPGQAPGRRRHEVHDGL